MCMLKKLMKVSFDPQDAEWLCDVLHVNAVFDKNLVFLLF